MTSVRQRFRALSTSGMGTPPWRAVTTPPARALPSSSELIIAGGGLTGLFLAEKLAAGGREVTVVDRLFGGGATTRSGGLIVGQTLVGPSAAFEGCEESLRTWISERRVECGLAWEGCLELVRSDSRPPDPVDWHDGGPVRLSRVVNGGVLDPARLLGGAMHHAARAGAHLVDGVTVEAIEAGASTVAIDTSQGRITAGHLVMATDAMLAPGAGEADPWDERGITVAMQTEPVSDAVLAALGLRANLAFYTDDLPLLWGRVMPDSSLLIGRELLPPTFDLPPQWLATSITLAGERLLHRARSLHGALAAVNLVRVWGGPIARTREGLPAVRTDPLMPRTTWVGGYGGHGLAQTLRVAEIAAEALQSTRARGRDSGFGQNVQ